MARRGGDGSGPIQPDVRVYDSLNVRDSGFRRAHAGGLTTLNCMPGSGHLLSGQTVYLKLRKSPRVIDDYFYKDAEGESDGRRQDGQRHQLDPRSEPSVAGDT